MTVSAEICSMDDIRRLPHAGRMLPHVCDGRDARVPMADGTSAVPAHEEMYKHAAARFIVTLEFVHFDTNGTHAMGTRASRPPQTWDSRRPACEKSTNHFSYAEISSLCAFIHTSVATTTTHAGGTPALSCQNSQKLLRRAHIAIIPLQRRLRSVV